MPPGCRSGASPGRPPSATLPITAYFIYLGSRLEGFSIEDPIVWIGAGALLLALFGVRYLRPGAHPERKESETAAGLLGRLGGQPFEPPQAAGELAQLGVALGQQPVGRLGELGQERSLASSSEVPRGRVTWKR